MSDSEVVTFTVKKRTIKIIKIVLIVIGIILLSYPVSSVAQYLFGYDYYVYVIPGVDSPQTYVDELVADLDANGIKAKQKNVTVDTAVTIGVRVREIQIEKAAELNFAKDKSIWDICMSNEHGPFVHLKNLLSSYF